MACVLRPPRIRVFFIWLLLPLCISNLEFISQAVPVWTTGLSMIFRGEQKGIAKILGIVVTLGLERHLTPRVLTVRRFGGTH